MPKVIPNSILIESISGAVGDLVFYRDLDDNLIIQRKGVRSAPPSSKQLVRQEFFKLASAYGNHVKENPTLSEQYRPFCHGRMRPYHAAVRDFMSPPTVNAIDLQAFTGQAGQLIRIFATDDTGVVRVHVQLRHVTSNALLEEGDAELTVLADEWIYSTQSAIATGTPVLVEATATDRPGHEGAAQAQCYVGM